MAFSYACFISYKNLEHRANTEVLEGIVNRIHMETEMSVGLAPWHDQERLKTGYIFDTAIGEAICASICMVVLYTPPYRRSTYCRREFEAMESLAQRRRQIIGNSRPELDFILPVVVRKDPSGVHEKIAGKNQYIDISADLTSFDKLASVCETIAELQELCEPYEKDLLGLCDQDFFSGNPNPPDWGPTKRPGYPKP